MASWSSWTGNKSRFITDHAIEFLDNAPAGKPFFLNIGYIATHSPYRQQEHDPGQTAKYANCPFDEIPPWAPHPWVKNEGGGNELNDEDLLDRYIGYYASVTEIDDNVARVIGALTGSRTMGKYNHHLYIGSWLRHRASGFLRQGQQHASAEYV